MASVPLERVNPEKLYTIEEFEALPDDTRYEMWNGRLYAMSSPTFIHQKLISQLSRVIGNHIADKKLPCDVIPAPFDIQPFENRATIVEPDVVVLCDRDKIQDGKRYVGMPESRSIGWSTRSRGRSRYSARS